MAQHFSLLPRFAAFARSPGSASRFDAAVVVEALEWRADWRVSNDILSVLIFVAVRGERAA